MIPLFVGRYRINPMTAMTRDDGDVGDLIRLGLAMTLDSL
jgi:hypothetical protein